MSFTYNQQIVVDLFIAAYGRAPTQKGLDFFVSKMEYDGWSDRDIANFMFDMNNNPEAEVRYPNDLSLEDKVNTIFEHVLGRDVATQKGMEYWEDKLKNPNYTFADVVLEVIKSAKEHLGDRETLEHKSEAVEYFLNNVPLYEQAGHQISTDDIITTNDVIRVENEIDDIKNDNINDYSYINESYDLPNYNSMPEIKALDTGENWSKSMLTYSFNKTLPPSYNETGFIPLTNKEKDVVRETFNKLEKYIDLDFKEVNDNGDIRFSNVDTGGEGGYTSTSWNTNGYNKADVFLSDNFVKNNTNYDFSLYKGGYGREIINHEIGHALGLKHPFEGEYTLDSKKDYEAYTIMSYTEFKNQKIDFYLDKNGSIHADYKGAEPDFYSLYDIETLQAKYGINDNANKEDNTYSFNFESGYTTLWDSGGEDTLDLSTTTGADYIQLEGGTLNSVDLHNLNELIDYYQEKANALQYNDWIRDIVTEGYNKGYLYDGSGNLGIAKGTIIENIFTGSGDDIIYDNSVDNIINSGAGDDKIFIGYGGLDHVDGGVGIDEVHINNKIENISIKQDGNKFSIIDEDNNYAAVLENVEYIVDSVGVGYSLEDYVS